MGKSRRNRGGPAHRRDPIARQAKPLADPELAALREAKVLPVIAHLGAADAKSRSAAAAAVSSIVHDPRCRKLLLREHLVQTLLTQTLTDAALESRAAGWGILQVLAREEAPDFCVHLFRQDILTAISFAVGLVLDKLQPLDASKPQPPDAKAQQPFVASIAASLVSLLTALAEAGDQVIDAISANPVFSGFLATLVSHAAAASHDPIAALRVDAMACLMVLCEDNVSLAEQLVAPGHDQCFQTMLSLSHDAAAAEGIIACATLHKIFASLDASKTPHPHVAADDSTLIATLAKVVASISPGQPPAADAAGWASPVERQQLALETLASIGTSLSSAVAAGPAPRAGRAQPSERSVQDDEDMGDAEDGPDGDDGPGGGQQPAGEDDEMDDDEIEADMDMVTGADDDDDDDAAADLSGLPVASALLQAAVPELMRVACLQPTDDDGMRLQGHALAALNNVAWSVSLVDFSDDHNADIQRAWAPVGRSIWERVISPILNADTADVALATQVTSLAWAVARSLGGDTPLGPGEHRKFIALYQATKGLAPADADDDEDPFQGLGVKCIGVLGQLALHPAPLDRNREIGALLVTLVAALPAATPPADAVEAVNQLLDVYADEAHPCDARVFWDAGFLRHLDDAAPKLRALAKSISRKTHPELRARADEAALNLGRFLAYKKKHKP